MTLLEAIAKVKTGIWQFIRLVLSANHEYPYHDYHHFENEEAEDDLAGAYIVGSGNLDAHGDQTKLFTSKRMLIAVTDQNAEIRLNSANNVPIEIPFFRGFGDCALIEIHTNVTEVFYVVPASSHIYIYCEGVLPEECRDAH